MKIAGLILIPTRAWILLLAVLVALCATNLAGPAMVMVGGQDCADPFCEVQIGCGQPTHPQNFSGYGFPLVAAPASGERLLPPGLVTRSPDLPPPRLSSRILGPAASRAPPAV